MTTTLKPLRECIRSFGDRVAKDYDAATTDKLDDIIRDCDSGLFFVSEDSGRVDALRTVSWFANAALTRRGICPRSREYLGSITTKPTRLIHDIRRQDAPYLDLQWLAFRYPKHIPKKWSGIALILATATSAKTTPTVPSSDDDIVFGELDRGEVLDLAFDGADLLIGRVTSMARRCMALRLSSAAQSEMRWLCSRKTHKLIREINKQGHELRDKMRRQGIKQLSPAFIEARVQTFRAWKLAGGGVNWQATANVLEAMTGVRKTRQAIRDMINRLGEQKLIKRRKGKTRTLEPILSK